MYIAAKLWNKYRSASKTYELTVPIGLFKKDLKNYIIKEQMNYGAEWCDKNFAPI